MIKTTFLNRSNGREMEGSQNDEKRDCNNEAEELDDADEVIVLY